MTAFCPYVRTASELRRTSRYLDRRFASVEEALAAIMKGEALLLQYENNHPLGSLSSGRSVSADAAALVIGNALVAPAGDALFDSLPDQDWRYVP